MSVRAAEPSHRWYDVRRAQSLFCSGKARAARRQVSAGGHVSRWVCGLLPPSPLRVLGRAARGSQAAPPQGHGHEAVSQDRVPLLCRAPSASEPRGGGGAGITLPAAAVRIPDASGWRPQFKLIFPQIKAELDPSPARAELVPPAARPALFFHHSHFGSKPGSRVSRPRIISLCCPCLQSPLLVSFLTSS